jgi:hypothetical protein
MSETPKLFIFQCTSDTYIGCMEKGVFGADKPWPLQVGKGDYCLLHHFEFGLVFGLWRASGAGGKNVVPRVWGGKFPYQVKIELAVPKVVEVPKGILAEFGVDPVKGRFDSVVNPELAGRVVGKLKGDK